MHLRSTRLAIALYGFVVLAAACGCAGWAPWKDPKEAARLAEKYGMTAKQRVADLEKRAKEAKEGDEERQAAFSQELGQLIVSEHDPRVRASIVEIASRFEVPAASAVCEGALQDPDPRVRSAACDAWAAKGGEQAVALIATRCRQEPDVDVRLRAIRSLGKLKQKSAIPVLAQSLEDPDPAIQYRAVAALKEVSGRDLGNDVNAWREWAAADEATRDASWSIAETFRRLF
jgi:HEAT repeat protein